MTEAQSIAADLKADGQPMTLTRTTPGVFDPITGSAGTPTVQTWTVYGRRGNFNSLQRLAAAGVNTGTLVQSGDRLFLISADQTTPVPSDVITDKDGVDWVVLAFDPVDGEDNGPVLFKVHVRK